MKKIIVLIGTIVSVFVTNAQNFPGSHPYSSPTTMEKPAGGLQAGVGLVETSYTDTTAANTNAYLKNYPGATFFSTSDNAIWLRNSTATKWLKQAGAIGLGTVTSVGALSPLFTTANGSTTPTFSLISQSQNLFFASPNGSSGNPSFRAIVAADLPAITMPISSLLAATTTNSISNSDYTQTWIWSGLYGKHGLSLKTDVAISGTDENHALLNVEYLGATNGTGFFTSKAARIVNSGSAGSLPTKYGLSVDVINGSSTNIGATFRATGTGSNTASIFTAGGGSENYAITVPADSGFVGIGTSTPFYQLHVQQAAGSVSVANITNTSGGNGLTVSGASTSTQRVLEILGGASGTTDVFNVNADGKIFAQLLPNLTTQNRLIGQLNSTGQLGNIIIGSNLSLSGGVLNTAAGIISGSGTTNYVQKVLVDGTIGNSSFQDDGITATSSVKVVAPIFKDSNTSIIPGLMYNFKGDIQKAAVLSQSSAAANFWGYKNLNAGSWSGGTATLTTLGSGGGAHNYAVGNIVKVTGVTPSGYNGTYIITAVPTTTTFSYAITSNPGAYVSGGNSTIESQAQITAYQLGTPAMIISANPLSVPSGIDAYPPVFAITGSDNGVGNYSWSVGVDGHSQLTYSGGVLKSFLNGVVTNFTSEHTIGWTNSTTANPTSSSLIDLSLARASTGNLKIGNFSTSTYYWNIGAGGIQSVTDNSIDIGASGATRPRNIYVGTNGVFGGKVYVADGSTGAPSYTFNSRTDCGMYNISNGIVGFSGQGTNVFRISSNLFQFDAPVAVSSNNTIDLAATATAFRSGYFATSLQTPLINTASGNLNLNPASGYVTLGSSFTNNMQGANWYGYNSGSNKTFIGGAGAIAVVSTGYYTIGSSSTNVFSGDVFLNRQSAGVFGIGTNSTNALGSLNLANITVSNKINITTGSNKSIGTATLSSGTVTVSTTAVTASSLIFVVYDTPSGTLAAGLSAPVASISAGTSFVINSLTTAGIVNTLDNSTVRWWFVN